MLVDDYVVDILMRDLVGHDHQPISFLIYLWLSYEEARGRRERVLVSYQTIADSVGISKRAAQAGVQWLIRRKLIEVKKGSPTGTSVPRSASLGELTKLLWANHGQAKRSSV